MCMIMFPIHYYHMSIILVTFLYKSSISTKRVEKVFPEFSLNVQNLLIYINQCQKLPGRKFKKLKVTLVTLLATYEMYEQAKSKINISSKLECFKKY